MHEKKRNRPNKRKCITSAKLTGHLSAGDQSVGDQSQTSKGREAEEQVTVVELAVKKEKEKALEPFSKAKNCC